MDRSVLDPGFDDDKSGTQGSPSFVISDHGSRHSRQVVYLTIIESKEDIHNPDSGEGVPV